MVNPKGEGNGHSEEEQETEVYTYLSDGTWAKAFEEEVTLTDSQNIRDRIDRIDEDEDEDGPDSDSRN